MESHTNAQRKPPTRILLTAKVMAALLPGCSVADEQIVGLCGRCSTGGRKAFALRYLDADGKERRKNIAYWPDNTPEQARDRAKVLKDTLLLKADPPAIRADKIARCEAVAKGNGAMTMAVFIQQHFEDYLVTTTRCGKTRIQDLRHAFAGMLELSLVQITATRVLAWRKQALTAMKPATVNRKVEILRGMLSRAVEWNFLARHPLTSIKQLEEPDGRERRLSDDERMRLDNVLRARDDAMRLARTRTNAFRRARRQPELPDLSRVAFADRLWALVIFTRETGLRWRECRLLRWENIDFQHRQLLVCKANAKSKKKRYVPLTAVGFAMLKGWREQTPGEWVFPNDGCTGPITTVRTAWHKVLRDADILDFRWHDLRHDFASRVAESGASIHVLSRWLGHTNNDTSERYINYSRAFLDQNVALFDAHNATRPPEAVATPPAMRPDPVAAAEAAGDEPTH